MILNQSEMARGNSLIVGYLMGSGQFVFPISKQLRDELCGSMIVGISSCMLFWRGGDRRLPSEISSQFRKVIVKLSLSFAGPCRVKGPPALLDWTSRLAGSKRKKSAKRKGKTRARNLHFAYPPTVSSHFTELNLPPLPTNQGPLNRSLAASAIQWAESAEKMDFLEDVSSRSNLSPCLSLLSVMNSLGIIGPTRSFDARCILLLYLQRCLPSFCPYK
jgi:hypothetical protein